MILPLEEDDFTIMKIKTCLTWQSPIIISAVLAEVGYSRLYLQLTDKKTI